MSSFSFRFTQDCRGRKRQRAGVLEGRRRAQGASERKTRLFSPKPPHPRCHPWKHPHPDPSKTANASICFTPRHLLHQLRRLLAPHDVDGGVGLAIGAHFAREREGGELARVDARLVQVSEVDLHGGVVLRRDQLVGPGAVCCWGGDEGEGVSAGREGRRRRRRRRCSRNTASLTTCAGCRDRQRRPRRSSSWLDLFLCVVCGGREGR